MLGIMAVGATFYAFEVPNYFRWIDKTVKVTSPLKTALAKTGLSLLYFNPLWISRHFLFILLASSRWSDIGWSLIKTGAVAWAFNIPLALIGNYIIQVKIPLKQRFFSSAIFSGIMAIYYALSEALFG